DQGSLAYRPPQLWQVAPDAVTAIQVESQGSIYNLKRDGFDWKISGPFEATASFAAVQPAVDPLANLKAGRSEAHAAENPADYGPDKPSVTLKVSYKEKPKEPADGKDVEKQKTLLIGKPAPGDKPGHFAKLADEPAVFIVNDALVANAGQKTAL